MIIVEELTEMDQSRYPGLSPSVETKVCKDCLQDKPISEFHPWTKKAKAPEQRRVGGTLNSCRECTNERMSNRRYGSWESTLKFRESGLKSQCKVSGMGFNLPPGYLTYLWKTQRGLCFYTDKEMTFGNWNDPANVSVDKIIPIRGYVVGNVVLCSKRANLVKNDMTLDEMKEWTPSWYNRIMAFLPKYDVGTFPMLLE